MVKLVICPSCKTECPGQARFCPGCGHDFLDTPEPTPVVSAQSVAAADMVPAMEGEGLATPQRSRLGLAAPVVACLAVAAVLAITLVWWWSSSGESNAAQAVAESRHAGHKVIVPLEAPQFTEESTRIPVRISGTDCDGNVVDKNFYIGVDGSGVELSQGIYSMTVLASPLLESGNLFESVAEPIDFVVGVSLAAGETVTLGEGKMLRLALADMALVSDDQIDYAYDLAKKDAYSAKMVDLLKEVVKRTRDNALEVEKEAKRKATLHVASGKIEIDMPEYWADKVTVVRSEDDIAVYPKGYSEHPLIAVRCGDTGASFYPESLQATCLSKIEGEGKKAELWGFNWAYLAWADKNLALRNEVFPDQAALSEGIDLLSGGSISYSECAVATGSSANSAPAIVGHAYDYVRDTVAKTLRWSIW